MNLSLQCQCLQVQFVQGGDALSKQEQNQLSATGL